MNTRRVLNLTAFIGLWLLLPAQALADNCGSLSDCYSTLQAALAAVVGIGVFAALFSLGLDFLPGVGTFKGVIEAFTGRDLVTSEELAWWERALGIVPIIGGVIGTGAAVARAADRMADAADVGGDIARAGRAADRATDTANAAGDASRARHGGGEPGGSGGRQPERPIRSRYGDGTPVYQGEQPPRITGPDPNAQGSHTVLRHDAVNNRVYQGREFDSAGNPVRDVDLTNPADSSGRPRSGHPGPPHQHRWHVNDPKFGPRSGFKRGGPEPLD